MAHADVAQLVEHHLAKVRVAGSNPVVRSTKERVRGCRMVQAAVRLRSRSRRDYTASCSCNAPTDCERVAACTLRRGKAGRPHLEKVVH